MPALDSVGCLCGLNRAHGATADISSLPLGYGNEVLFGLCFNLAVKCRKKLVQTQLCTCT